MLQSVGQPNRGNLQIFGPIMAKVNGLILIKIGMVRTQVGHLGWVRSFELVIALFPVPIVALIQDFYMDSHLFYI